MKRNLFLILFSAHALWLYAGITPVRLTCEDLVDPAVIDRPEPRLSWVNQAQEGERGQYQTAYQIRVASAKEKLEQPDLWNSGKISSDQSILVPYAGTSLASRQECWWQVRVWDKEGAVSAWSSPAFWRMGLLSPDDWDAQWIGAPWQGEEALPKPPGGPDAYPNELPPPAPFLRRSFQLDKEIQKAVVFVTGLGYFELHVNGSKVGDDVLVPNQTNYGKRPQLPQGNIPLPDDFTRYSVMYLAYDLTPYLKTEENVIGAILGNGFYNAPKFWTASYGSPRFLCQLHLTYADGTEEVIVSDDKWKAAQGPILMDLVYHGEHYDARKEMPGWSTPAFNDADWQEVAIRKAPYGDLVAHMAPTDKVTKQLQPKSIHKFAEGEYVVDFGEEISGWLRLNGVEGPAGHQIEIIYNGNLYSGDHTYVFDGRGPASYAPRFNWFVFSGVTLRNWPGELEPSHITAEAVNTQVEETAVFEASNPLFQRINEIWKRSQLDNMHGGIASDCPHRERSGYTGDGQVACVTVMHNFDSRTFYRKWITDMHDAQIKSTGYVPNGAPWQPGCGGGVAWGAAICIMPWEFYLHYGDLEMLADNYEAMQGYIKYMDTWIKPNGIMHSQRKGKDGKILKWFNLGEWAAPGETVPNELVHTFYYWYCADITAKTAYALGDEENAGLFEQKANHAREAFHQNFYDDEKGSYGDAGGDVLALVMGVPSERYEKVVQSLENNMVENNGHLDTGIFGTRFLFETLATHGLHHLAYQAMNKRTEPSYGHWLELGSTTTREHWDTGGSHNHPMFGGGLVWLYRNLAGMQTDERQPGYRNILFRPQFIDSLDWVAYHNLTPYGTAGIRWERVNGKAMVEIQVPVGSSAEVILPVAQADVIKEGNASLDEVEGIHEVQRLTDGVHIFLTQGNFQFQWNLD